MSAVNPLLYPTPHKDIADVPFHAFSSCTNCLNIVCRLYISLHVGQIEQMKLNNNVVFAQNRYMQTITAHNNKSSFNVKNRSSFIMQGMLLGVCSVKITDMRKDRRQHFVTI